MHAALWQLLWLDFRGSFRGVFNFRRNWRQMGLLVLLLGFVGLFIAARWLDPDMQPSGRFDRAMPFWALIYLLLTWLTASADRGLVMRPAEIHFVVSGPFANRDVITLSLVRLAFRAMISAAVLSLLAIAYVDSYLSALCGLWLMISVSLLVGMLASLSTRRAQGAIVKGLRRLFSVAGIVCLLLLISQAMQAVKVAGQSPQVSAIAAAALETPLGKVVLPPLAWMFAPLSSPQFAPDTLILLPSRLVVIAGLVALIYLLGSQFAEVSTNRTDLSVAKRQNALRSGVAGGAVAAGWTRRLALPLPYRLGGIGSVAWMQMVHSLRILPRYLMFTAAIVGVVLVVPLMVDSNRLAGMGAVGWMAGLTGYADFLLLLQLPVGFLGPVAQREMLKGLPITAWRVAVGQLAGPLIPLAVLHMLVTGLFIYLKPDGVVEVLQTAVALLPAALVMVANINLLGAWNIIRPRALQQRDALAAGRAMASVWIFMAMLLPAIILSTISAYLMAAWLGAKLSSYLLGVAAGTLLSSTFYIVLLARAFTNWQPTGAEGGQEEAEYDR